jgi:ATP-dependent exoDNAse (exonuclease V) alpha subunit
MPQPGDRLICLRNNYMFGLLNGSTWLTRSAVAGEKDAILLGIVADDPSDALNSVIYVKSHLAFFRGSADAEMSYLERRKFDPFDFGNAITAHKAQGSQYPNVVLVDESGCFGHWFYTGLTRAIDKVTVVVRD